MQRKLYTEFDLLFEFISANAVFGLGNKVLVFQFFGVGYEFSSVAFKIFSCNVINVIKNNYISLGDQMYLCIKTWECT